MNTAQTRSRPKRKWSVEGFAYFWSELRDPAAVADVVWPEVKGYWPRAAGPLVGCEAYVAGVSNFLSALPEFSLRVSDHARDGDVAFVRWVLEGDFLVGPSTMAGVDRLILKEGYVIENHIHSDHPLFARLAERRLLG